MTERPAADPALVEALAAVARRLDSAARLAPIDPTAALDAVAATAVVVLDAQAASIAIHDPATDTLRFAAAAGPSAGEVVGLAIDAAAGLAGYAFSSGQPIAVAEAAADPRFDRRVADATGYLPGSILATPILDAESTLGVLEVLDRRGGPFTLRDLDVAAALARQAAIAIRDGRLARDGAELLARSLRAVVAAEPTAALDDAAIETIVAAATADLADATDDPTWALADRVARLRAADGATTDLLVAWLDALIAHGDRRR